MLLERYLACNVGLRNALRSTVDFNKAMDLALSFNDFSFKSYNDHGVNPFFLSVIAMLTNGSSIGTNG